MEILWIINDHRKMYSNSRIYFDRPESNSGRKLRFADYYFTNFTNFFRFLLHYIFCTKIFCFLLHEIFYIKIFCFLLHEMFYTKIVCFLLHNIFWLKQRGRGAILRLQFFFHI